jgi:hypothetical protein
MAAWAGTALRHPGWAGVSRFQQAGVLSSAPGPGQPPPAWADVPFRPASQRGPAPPSLGVGRPADPARFCPSWAAGWVTRLGLFPAPGWARIANPGWAGVPGWASSPLRPGRPAAPRPGWAGSGGSGLAGILLLAALCKIRLGRFGCIPAGPGWHFPGPGRITPKEGRDIHSWAGLLHSQAEIHLLRHTLLVQHQLQRLVPVLGRL